MASPKQSALELLDGLPDDASLEDIQYHLFVLQRVEKGIDEAADGRVVSEAEMEKRFAKWTVP